MSNDEGLFLRSELKKLPNLSKEPSLVLSGCKIRAGNDREAIERWWDEYFDKPTTFRTYKKEAERFYIWCASVQKKNLRNLCREDVESYAQFLTNPQPSSQWCGPKGGRKKNQQAERAWYPFSCP